METLFVLGAVFLVVGIAMVAIAMKYRTAAHPPVPTSNTQAWKPVWKMQDYYTRTGFRLQLVGWLIIIISAVALGVCFLVPLL